MKNFLVAITFLAILGALPAPVWGQSELPKSVQKGLKQVSPRILRDHVAYLADDRLLGRLPGTPGYLTAVEYVEARYRELGLEPAGESGSYRQKVRIRTARPVAAESSMRLLIDNRLLPLEYGTDFAVQADFNAPSVEVKAGLVFAGYGISAPKLGYDDYEGLDVKGRIVVVIDRAPADRFSSTEMAHLGRLRTKIDMAQQHGAAGLLLLPSPVIGANFIGIAGRLSQGLRGVVLPDGRVDGGQVNPYPQLRVVGYLSWEGLGKVLEQPEKSSKELIAMAFSKEEKMKLKGTLLVKTASSYQEIESYNVIGRIPGADPKLKNEYVIHTAHLDHVGVGRQVEGDSIYNGAHDNASGVGSLLEIARIYSGLKKNRPQRSILFVMVTAEEMGLLGSYYFAKNPTVPREMIVANINTDMPTILAPLLGVVPLGAEHSSLMEVVKQAAGHLDLEVMDDPMPDEVRFVRSDQYSFVVQGIPALHIKYGFKTASPDFDLAARVRDFTQNHYHKPSDELNDSFDFEAGRTYIRLNFLISYLVATQTGRPYWLPGSIFAPALPVMDVKATE